jgi:hypothetical protein
MAGEDQNNTTQNNGRNNKKMNPTPIFDGTREQLKSFLFNLDIFLEGQAEDYKEDGDRILFALSYLRGDKINTWKEDWLDAKRESTIPGSLQQKLGTYEDFIKDLKKSFSPVNQQGNALVNL